MRCRCAVHGRRLKSNSKVPVCVRRYEAYSVSDRVRAGVLSYLGKDKSPLPVVLARQMLSLDTARLCGDDCVGMSTCL